MRQGVLPFQYVQARQGPGMTALAGLPLYLELAETAGLPESIRKHVGLRREGQGWTDEQMVMALVMLNLAGGEAVQDLEVLEKDEGFCAVLRKVESQGLRRRELEGRWRKEQRRSVPSESATFRCLAGFHDAEEEKRRQPNQAFIPAANRALQGLRKVNADLVALVQKRAPQAQATLDMDATLVETWKEGALFSYKGYKAYQPLNTYWAEQRVMVDSEFRDGNVPAGHEQRRVLEQALGLLPSGVEDVLMRSDTAGYQQELLRFCAEGKDQRFGVIQFAVGVDVTEAFRQAVREVPEEAWQPLQREGAGEPAIGGAEMGGGVLRPQLGRAPPGESRVPLSGSSRAGAAAGAAGNGRATALLPCGVGRGPTIQGDRRGDQPGPPGRSGHLVVPPAVREK